MPRVPIDPLEGPKLALSGRLVTMDDGFGVLEGGTVYIENGRIVNVVGRGVDPPASFEDVDVLPTRGTVFPGLIELHNHLAYNVLRLWDVPERYLNRDRWSGTPEYRRLVTGPMTVIGTAPALLPAAIRYVEAKALVAGTTTSQGVALFSNAGARRYYRGIVRNVEKTDDPDLAEAATKIDDVDAVDAERFLARLKKRRCFILHLSEGTDDAARAHFLALRLADGGWALAPSLAGIHCAALRAEDFEVMAAHGASMVWSPLSNLLLYGRTADVKAAVEEGVRIGLGSDWSPTGSKNLLGELKLARLASANANTGLGDRELVAMATRNAAGILGWNRVLGSLEAGKYADLLVIDGQRGDPYDLLLGADERDVSLVAIGGVARFGHPSLVRGLGADGERIRVGGRERLLNLRQATADPVVGALSLAEAKDTLTDALRRLKEIRLEQERQPPIEARIGAAEPLTWFLALDELQPTGMELRPRVPLPGATEPTGPTLETRAAVPLSDLLGPLKLDRLTVADDPGWLELIDRERNLPTWVAPGLRQLYGL